MQMLGKMQYANFNSDVTRRYDRAIRRRVSFAFIRKQHKYSKLPLCDSFDYIWMY